MKIVKKKEDILSLLNEFSVYTPRLFQIVNDIEGYAEKLEKYAYIIVDNENNNNKGLICFYANDNEKKSGFISLIVVKDKYRKTGIGKKLIQFASDIMIENNMKNIGLMVYKNNNNAIGFYQHLGFEIEREENSDYYMSKVISN